MGLLVVCAAVSFWAWNRHHSDIKWIERASGVAIPAGINDLHIQRPREFCIAGKMTLPARDVEKFLKANRFTPRSDYPLNIELGLDPAAFKDSAALKQWYGLEGRTQAHHWEFAFDPAVQALWFVVLFPDAHGDPPP